MHFDELLKYIRDTHYIHPFFFIINIVALIFSIKNKYKGSSLNIFIYYFAAFIVLNLILYSAHLFPTNTTRLLLYYFDFCFTIFEYVVFAAFITLQISNPSKKKLVFNNTICFLSVSFLLFLNDTLWNSELDPGSKHVLFIVQSLSLLLHCAC